MGSPGGGDREKDLSKRRKSESSYYVKSRDWVDDETYDEDRRHRSSKSKKSSRSDREREKAERDREPDRVGRSRDEFYEKGEKRSRSSKEDRHEEKLHDREVLESRAGSSKRRNASSNKTEASGVEADDGTEGLVGKQELEEEKARKVVAKSPEKDRGRKGELRADRGHDGPDEKYRRSDRGEALDEDSARKRSSQRDRHYAKEEERLWKESNRAERGHDYVELDSRKFETRPTERYSDDDKVRHSDAYVEEAQNGDMVNYQRVDMKVERSRKGDRTHDNDDDTIYEISVRHERASRTITSSGMDPSHSKSRKHVEEKKSERRIYDERDTRDVDSQAEGGERFVESSGLENRPRSSSRNEKGREHVSRERGSRLGEVLVDVEGAAGSVPDSKQKWDRMRNGSGKSRGERDESKKDISNRVERIEEELVVARSDHREEVRDLSENIPESRSRRKEKASSRWDKPDSMLEEAAELERGGNGAEAMQSRWNEPEEDTFALEEERETVLREPESVDVIESEEGNKPAIPEKVGEVEIIPEHEASQDLEPDPVAGEHDSESQLEKPERHRRAKERLEREEWDEWEKSTDHRHVDKSEWVDPEEGSKLEGELEEGGEEVRKSGRRRGRDTLEREDYDYGGRFLGRVEKDRDREKEREKERDKERLREREKGKERARERGRDRGRRDEVYWDDHQRKGSERYDDGYYEHDRPSGRGREDYEREKYRSREESDDRHGRSSRREEERISKLVSKESIHDSSIREKEEEDRLRRLRSGEEEGKKPASREYIDETRKAEGLVDRVKGAAPDISGDGGRMKGKHVTSRSPDDRRDSYRSGKASRSPDDRRGHRSGKAYATSRSPDDRRGGVYRSSKAVTGSRSPDDRRSHRNNKAVSGSRSPDDRKGGRSDWDGNERDWSDSREEYDREKRRRRGNQMRDRDSAERKRDNRSREKPHERNWERAKGKDVGDRSHDRHQNRWKGNRDAEYQGEQDNWESNKRHDNEKQDRKMMERDSSERSRMDRERVDDLRSPQGFALLNESAGRGHQVPSNYLEAGRGGFGPYMPPGGDPGFFQGDYFGGMGEVDWDGPMMDDRMRPREGIFLGGGDRFMDNEGPLGHDPGFRGAAGDGAMSYNHHPGRGRGSKASPNNRGRGGIMGHDGRPHYNSNQAGPMLRGMQQQQQGGKGGRGTRGGPKGGRGPGREVPRASVNPPLMGPGPGIGPHFGPMGPQGMMPGMAMGPGPSPGPFPLLPFGGPMGWGGGPGGGEMAMMGPGPGPVMGPAPMGPRFMAPGPGPNMFFNPPGPGRGGPGVMPTGSFGGGAPLFNGPNAGGGGGRGQMGDRGPPGGGGRGLIARANGPLGRGPSRGEQNDYSQHFVDTGLRPQNFIRDVELADRFEEYPKLKELITRKDQLIAKRATPPMYMQCDLRTTELSPETFGTKFDVILVDPPWEEYVRRAPGCGDSMEWWSVEEIQNLRIEAIADTPAFIFLWVGDAEGLEQGRHCLKKWGFRRCEDICWVKTNRENPTPALRHDANTLFQHSKEHCLMGIKGTVRRSTDGHIIHANVDTDIIISEEPEYGSTKKPEELYHIIEHFAQGMRRIELFGEDHNIRAGWVTVGKNLTSSNFKSQTYAKNFADSEGKVWQGGRGNPAIDANHLVGTTPEIEALRPKSPPPRPQQAQPSGQGNAGNSISQPSAGNSISKKASTGGGGGAAQNGHPAAALVPGAGHGSANPPVIGQPPYVGGRGGGHGQIPKLRPVLPGTLMKPLGAGPGLVDMGVFDEDASFGGDVQEATSAEN